MPDLPDISKLLGGVTAAEGAVNMAAAMKRLHTQSSGPPDAEHPVPDLDAAIRNEIDAAVTEIKGSDPNTFVAMAADELRAALLAILDQLHVLDGISQGITETRSPILGSTVQKATDSIRRVIAEALGVSLTD